MAEPARKLPEEDQANIRPNLGAQESANSNTAGGQSWSTSSSTAGGSDGATSSTGEGFVKSDALRDREESPDEDSDDDRLGKGYSPSPNSNSTSKRRIRFTKRRAAAGGGIAGVIVTVVFGGLSVVQGPFQFVHFAQLLQKFHFGNNEDFGDDRGAKLMLYAMAGSAERGRLGFVTNPLADRWEKRMIKKTGLRPLYSKTGRLVAYEIVSNKKDRFAALQEVLDKNPKLAKNFDRLAANGTEIRSYSEALARGELRRTGSGPGQGFVIDNRDVNGGFRQTRVFTRAVGSSMVGSKIVGSMPSRLLIKRGGVGFHFFNNAKKAVDAAADANTRKKQAEDYEKNILKRWSESIKIGIRAGIGKNKEARDLIEKTEQETEGKSSSETKTLRTAAAKVAGPAAAIGIICGVKSLGDDADAAKYVNNVLPMMRMGVGIVTMGNQVMSGQDINLDEAGAMNKQLYDEETKTSWTSARSIQAELGQPQTGPGMPKEAKLSNVSDKGDLFESVTFIVNNVPGLSFACGAIDTISGLPIISQFSSLVQGAINGPLNLAGTSTDELMAGLIGVINGDSINPLAKGAELGNLANTGAFLAANDQAIATGGTALSNKEVAQLDERQRRLNTEEQSQKSFIARYFDPYDYTSLAGKVIDNAPSSSYQMASLINPVKTFGSSLSSLFSVFAPRAQAAQAYDYGVSTYGFSLTDQEKDMFENPYENAVVVEPLLPVLNEKYGKCFGMTVDENGSLQNGEAVNVFKLEKDSEYKDCRDDKDQEIFKRYRFYIADTVTAKSLACYEGDDAACVELGAGGSADTGTTTSAGVEVDVANIREPSTNIDCAEGTKDLGVKDGYTQGKKVKIRLCEVSNLPQPSGYGKSNGNASVNSRMSGAVYAMVEAAKKDGINLVVASGFRTMAEQQSLCPCDGVSVAIPGTSNHQLGVALDFNIDGLPLSVRSCVDVNGLCTPPGGKSHKQWKWLVENGEKFKMKQYKNEFWHFSPLEN